MEKERGRQPCPVEHTPNEESRLIDGLDGSVSTIRTRKLSRTSTGPPGSSRRHSAASADYRLAEGFGDKEKDYHNPWLRNILEILGVIVAGVAGWTVAWSTGAWKPVAGEGDQMPGNEVAIGAEIFGYMSAALYLGLVNLWLSRFPADI